MRAGLPSVLSPGDKRLTLALGAAHHSLLHQRVDLALRIAELGEHLGRVLAEFGRRAAQARLAAFQTDGRSDPFVPILFDHIAAVEGVRVGQRLIDLLYRTGRQARGEQPVAYRLRLVLTEHGGQLLAQRLAVGDAILVARKARTGAEFSLTDLLGELAERAVLADP